VKLLFDQGTPAPLRHALAEHEVVTAFERGWQNLQNGELLRAAEADGFAAVITTDQSLRYQQNLAKRRLAVVVLKTTDWRRIRQQLEEVSRVVSTLTPGAFIELPFPRRPNE
jgi:hypothetical protein